MKRVLVCDDEQDILDIIEMILCVGGWDVVTTQHLYDIIGQVEKAAPNVILMDNWIPNSGGIVATQTLKKHPDFKKIPVIYITANSDIQALANEAGAEFSVAKPFDLDLLEKVVGDAYKASLSNGMK